MTRGEMLARMTLPEFEGWKVYDRVFGLGDLLEVLGVLGTMIASASGARNVKPGDIVPYFGGARPDQTDEEMKAIFGGFAARQNHRKEGT